MAQNATQGGPYTIVVPKSSVELVENLRQIRDNIKYFEGYDKRHHNGAGGFPGYEGVRVVPANTFVRITGFKDPIMLFQPAILADLVSKINKGSFPYPTKPDLALLIGQNLYERARTLVAEFLSGPRDSVKERSLAVLAQDLFSIVYRGEPMMAAPRKKVSSAV